MIGQGWVASSFLVRTVEQPDGLPRDCYIHPKAPGLCVNRRDDLWVVSHVRSGSFIQPAFTRAAEAATFALAIAPAGDWTRPGRIVLADEPLRGRVVIEREKSHFRATGIAIECAAPYDPALDA